MKQHSPPLLLLAILTIILGTVFPSSGFGESHPSLPRFASLRSKEVNLRVGPGKHYPIEWTFVRAHIPVEVTAEFYTWRKIRDWQGTEGWIHQSMLSGTRTGVVLDSTRTCYKRPETSSTPVAQMESGAMVKLNKAKDQWVQVQAEGYKCWLPQDHIWGIYPQEILD